MPVQIAIDASRATVSQPTGTEAYSLRLIRALIAANHERRHPCHFQLYFREQPAPELFPDMTHAERIVLPLPRLWTHLRFAAALWRRRPDITFVPAHTLPLFFPGAGVVTAHDLGYKHFPRAHPPAQRMYLDATTRYSCARANIVLADSQATARDLERFYGAPRAKMRVVYPGVDEPPSPPTAADIAAVREKFRLPQRYFLFLGTLQPRKNIERIIQAFGIWQRRNADRDTALVLAGARGWLFDEGWMHGAENLRLTGYVDEADKAGLYGGALALVFPSLYEGFGFPALEAMRCGAPVIASDSSSLRELVGEAGLLVNPLSADEIAAAMARIVDDSGLREELRRRGYDKGKRFTWSNAAGAVMRVFDELAERAPADAQAIC